jgi:hypothetical protein
MLESEGWKGGLHLRLIILPKIVPVQLLTENGIKKFKFKPFGILPVESVLTETTMSIDDKMPNDLSFRAPNICD